MKKKNIQKNINFNVTKLNFNKMDGLIPAVIQDSCSLQILMLAFMNKEALNKTLQTKKVTFYSRSRKKIWTKGETSGNFLIMEDIMTDCDTDSVLILAKPKGPTCHKNNDSCFKKSPKNELSFLSKLEQIITLRKKEKTKKSYTYQLLNQGLDKICQKVGEEATETIIAAKNKNKTFFLNEVADLIYHLMVLLKIKQSDLKNITNILQDRHKN